MPKFMVSAAAFFMACFSALAQEPPKACEARAEQPMLVVPAGTPFSLILIDGISTRTAKRGQAIHLQTLSPVVVGDQVVIPAGSFVQGQLAQVRRPGRIKGRAEVQLQLNRLILPNGYAPSLDAHPTDADTGGNETVKAGGAIEGDTDRALDTAKVITATAGGAFTGLLFTFASSKEGIAIGAGAGAVALLIAELVRRGPELEMPRGSVLSAVLQVPLYLDPSRLDFADAGRASALPPPPDRRIPHGWPRYCWP